MYLFYDKYYYYNLEALSLIVLSNVFLITPLSNFEKHNNLLLLSLNKSKFKFLALFSIGIGLFSISFYVVGLGGLFYYGARIIRNTGIVLYESGTLSSYMSAFSFMISPLVMFLGFYNMSKKILHIRYTILLMISSTVIIFYTLGVAGRDGMVIWLISLLGLLCLFYPYLSPGIIKKMKLVIIVTIIIMTPIFMLITNDRVGSGPLGSRGSIFSYLGQSLNNLSHNIDHANKTGHKNINYRTVFGLYYEFSDRIKGDRFNIHVYNSKSTLLGFRGNKFSYYIGGFYPYSTDTFFLFLFILLSYVVIKRNLKVFNGKTISPTRLMIVFSWYMIIMVGIFYFYYGDVFGNMFLLLPFILLYYFDYFKPDRFIRA